MQLKRILSRVIAGVGAAALICGSASATTFPIQHVVVIFQENVSFDHYFGTYPNADNPSGEPVFTAAKGTPKVNGLSAALLNNNPNLINPFRLDLSQAATCDQDHDYTDEQLAFDNFKMDKFVQSVGVGAPGCPDYGFGKGLTMGYFDGNTVTALWNYAQNFAMNDNSFGTTFGPSTPGALNLIAGQTNGATPANQSGDTIDGSVIGDPQPAGDVCTTRDNVTMSGKNIGDLLNDNGITWGFFQGGFDLTKVNPNGSTGCKRSHTSTVTGVKKGDYIPHHEPFQYYPQTANPNHTRPSSVAAIGSTDAANHQYDIDDFFAAVANGNMPAVSFLKAAGYQDGHAGYSSPLDEQTFVVNTINTLENTPEWNSTAVFIMWDDSDGWYDHQPGHLVSSSTTEADALTGVNACGKGPKPGDPQGRCGYGPRLPFLVVSPYAKANFVSHNETDQSSAIRFIEDNWHTGRLGNNSFDAIAGNVTDLFDFGNGNHTGKLILDPSTGEVTP